MRSSITSATAPTIAINGANGAIAAHAAVAIAVRAGSMSPVMTPASAVKKMITNCLFSFTHPRRSPSNSVKSVIAGDTILEKRAEIASHASLSRCWASFCFFAFSISCLSNRAFSSPVLISFSSSFSPIIISLMLSGSKLYCVSKPWALSFGIFSTAFAKRKSISAEEVAPSFTPFKEIPISSTASLNGPASCRTASYIRSLTSPKSCTRSCVSSPTFSAAFCQPWNSLMSIPRVLLAISTSRAASVKAVNWLLIKATPPITPKIFVSVPLSRSKLSAPRFPASSSSFPAERAAEPRSSRPRPPLFAASAMSRPASTAAACTPSSPFCAACTCALKSPTERMRETTSSPAFMEFAPEALVMSVHGDDF